jgi:hypothetical protein
MADPSYIVDGVLTDSEAWVALNTETVGSDVAQVTFKSGFDDTDTDVGGVQAWDQYMDLVLIAYVQTAATGVAYSYLDTYFNNDTTGSNYARQWLGGDGSSVTAQSTTTIRLPVANVTLGANVFGAAVVHFLDINSGKYKSVLFEAAHDGDGSGWLKIGAATWKNQAAITEIDLVGWQGSYDIKAGSVLSLFGVLPRMVA